MVTSVISSAIDATTAHLGGSINWPDITAALVVTFTDRNKGDLHIEMRGRLGIMTSSNKTHIDLTSGDDLPPGLSPVLHFFDVDEGKAKIYPARMNMANLISFGYSGAASGDWIDSRVRVRRILPRNLAMNPSAQLLDKDDLAELRRLLTVGNSLILLRHSDRSLDAIGVETTPELSTIVRGSQNKTKRMFLPDPAEVKNSAPTADPNVNATTKETKDGSKTKSSSVGQGIGGDAKTRAAVDIRAMEVSTAALEASGHVVTDVHTPELAIQAGLGQAYPGYDLVAEKNHRTYRIEVKGTQGQGGQVFLTLNELKAANRLAEWSLVVVSGISVEMVEGSAFASGGDPPVRYDLREGGNLKDLMARLEGALKDLEVGGLSLLAMPAFVADLGSELLEKASFE